MVNAAALAMLLLWHFSHGFTANGVIDGLYELQANSMAHGRLDVIPGPRQMFCHDILLWWGKYYFYQGLFPSVVLLVVSKVVGRLLAHYLIAYCFLLVFAYFMQRILIVLLGPDGSSRSLIRSYWPAVVLLWALILVLMFPFEKGYVEGRWFFGRFLVYEQQIMFGLACGVPGVYYLIRGLSQKTGSDLAVSVFCFSLAAWVRVTWFPPAALLLVGVAFTTWRTGKPVSRKSLAYGLIAAALLCGLLYLNYHRFGSPFDFGLKYINMGNYAYQRDVKQYFSLGTRFWNFWYTIGLYYVSPGVMDWLGLTRLSYAWTIGRAPSFFCNNVIFVAMLILIPGAMERAYRTNRQALLSMIVLLGVAVYFNILLGIVSTVVVLRYFMDPYYFMLMLFTGVLAAWVRPAYVLAIILATQMWYIPGTVEAFARIKPELRTVRIGDTIQYTSPRGPTWFLEPNPVWPEGVFSADYFNRMTRYNAIGIKGEVEGVLIANDCFAVYLIPGAQQRSRGTAELTIRGLGAIKTEGSVHLFFEHQPVARLNVFADRTVDVRIGLPFGLNRDSPYQVLGFFVPKGSDFLPPHSPGVPVIHFREIRLQ